MGKWSAWRTGSDNGMPEQGSSDYNQIQGSETLVSSEEITLQRDFKVATAIWNFLCNLKHKTFFFRFGVV